MTNMGVSKYIFQEASMTHISRSIESTKVKTHDGSRKVDER